MADRRPEPAGGSPRIAVVTGANRGIGREVARQLAARGDVVVLGSRDPAEGEAAAAAARHPRREFFLSPRTGTFTNDGKRLAISDGTGSVFVWRTSNR